MIIANLFFYIFAFLITFSTIMVVISRNTVYSVLFLIFAFFNVAGLFILLNAEFLAMLMIIVYVGAVAVLFLFVVMMMDINSLKSMKFSFKNLIMPLILAGLLLTNIIFVSYISTQNIHIISRSDYPMQAPSINNNVNAIGEILYTDFIVHFQLAGLVLFVAMIGCIMLTLRTRPGVKKQDAYKQVLRNKDSGLKVVKVKNNEGVDGIDY